MNVITTGARMAAIVSMVLFANAAIGQAHPQVPPLGVTSSTVPAGGGAGAGTVPPPDIPPRASGKAAGSAGTANSAANATANKLSAADKKMMTQLAQANIAEIDAAKLAQKQTKNPDVLAFAQKMTDDHTQAANELAQLAQSRGMTLPEKPDAKHQAMAKKMGKLSDHQFDKQYMANAGVADHRATIALLKRINIRAADPDLKTLAGKLLPTVEQHLSMAEQKKQ